MVQTWNGLKKILGGVCIDAMEILIQMCIMGVYEYTLTTDMFEVYLQLEALYKEVECR